MKLKSATIRLGVSINKKTLQKYLSKLIQIPYLRLTCVFDSRHFESVIAINEQFPRLTLVCPTLRTDLVNLRQLAQKCQIGSFVVTRLILSNKQNLDDLFDLLVFLPQRGGAFEIPAEFCIHKKFQKLLKEYDWEKLEIVGGKNEISPTQKVVVRLDQCTSMRALKVMDCTFKNVEFVLPKSLESFSLLGVNSIRAFPEYDYFQKRLGNNFMFSL
ncbi:hypothetical protein EIN_508090 [Entamoeba invadens IP1]|uniref:Uncharacterized protein n=1 Tax=Entamoeba invadens IP1 TaxID=370355 RepID=A0A0A1UC84_ENTIV|nr:hypothetical protein EIN_508090 [Entamoeba invadens IP1]ELP92858.1 hypothetical protein EIN_508090 [Entamoeba invadens IP1]|eukprot:XP_004259629.1 hypothetical protein EIN_508090 [Entamoeba invadens IP1]